MRVKQCLAALAIAGAFLAAVGPARADVVIDQNTTIDAANSYPAEAVEVVDGASPPTVVNVVAGGEVFWLESFDTSIVNMSGGRVSFWVASDWSTADLSAGTVDDLNCDLFGTVKVRGGNVTLLASFGLGQALVSGGNVSVLETDDTSSASVSAGTVSQLNAFGSSMAGVTGGVVRRVDTFQSSVAEIAGGLTADSTLSAHHQSIIRVYGSNLTYADNVLSGMLLDGTVVTIPAFEYNDGQIVLQPGEPVNAINDQYTTDEDKVLSVAAPGVLANDRGVGRTVIDVDDASTLGAVTWGPDGRFDYDPDGQFDDLNDGQTATDRFFYTIRDSLGVVDTAAVTITIEGVGGGGGNGGGGECPSTALLAGTIAGVMAVGDLRHFRDDVMGRSKLGAEYADLYYRHAPEVVGILRRDPQLARDSQHALLRLIPKIRGVLQKRREKLTGPDGTLLDGLLQRLAAKAGPELQFAVGKVQTDLHEGKLATLFAD